MTCDLNTEGTGEVARNTVRGKGTDGVPETIHRSAGLGGRGACTVCGGEQSQRQGRKGCCNGSQDPERAGLARWAAWSETYPKSQEETRERPQKECVCVRAWGMQSSH